MTQKKTVTLIVLIAFLFSLGCNKNVSSQSNKTLENSSNSLTKTDVEAEKQSPETPFSLSAQIQPRAKTSSGYLRSSIEEKLSAERKRPFLKFLDEGRVTADQAMKLLADAKYDEFYKSTSEDFKSQYSQEQFSQLIKAFEQSAGKIVSYEFRNQALEFPIGVALSADLSRASSSSYYSIKPSKIESDGFFMEVETMMEKGKHVVSFVTTQNYEGKMPDYLIKTSVGTTQKKKS